MIAPGCAFFNAEAPGVPRHLWFVVCRCGTESVVIVNVSTNPGPDNQPCAIHPGDHPGISRTSYLRCDKSQIVEATRLELLAEKQLISSTSSLSDALLSKLRQDLLASPHTPAGVKEAIRAASK